MNYINLFAKKNEFNKLSIEDINLQLPIIKNKNEPLIETISGLIIDFVKKGLEQNRFKKNTLLPPVDDIAKLLGVSKSTIQVCIRNICNLGYLTNVARFGNVINTSDNMDLSNTKRHLKNHVAIIKVKELILENNLVVGDLLPSTKILSNYMEINEGNVRSVLSYLMVEGFVTRKFKNKKEYSWVITSIDFSKIEKHDSKNIEIINEKVLEQLKEYVEMNYSTGENLPSRIYFINKFSCNTVSIKYAYDKLIEDNIIAYKRGCMGAYVLCKPSQKNASGKEYDIFASAQDVAMYRHEKVEKYIKKIINESYPPGTKLPSVKELSKELGYSTYTIRTALHKLKDDGFILMVSGNNGGTFVLDTPIEEEKESYKWLAVNPQYAEVLKN